MFDFCFKVILNELNAYIQSQLDEETVVYANLADYSADSESKMKNRVVMSLVDIIQEGLNATGKAYVAHGSGYVAVNQPILFRLYVLFSACFQNDRALEGLRQLEQVIAFFHHKNDFTAQNTPALQEANLDAISIDLVKLDSQEKQALWSRLRVPYRPSVLYKVGLVPVGDSIKETDMSKLPVIPSFKNTPRL
jgi:hypothetical protein